MKIIFLFLGLSLKIILFSDLSANVNNFPSPET